MLVYGDHCVSDDPRQRAREIDRRLEAVETMAAGLQRHARLVAALVEAGQLLQGLADADFAQRQVDRRTAATYELSAALLEMARAVCRSWDTGFEELAPLPRVQARPAWPDEVRVRVPEGFAYYGVYPEAYIAAARRLALRAPPRVVGIRSIGTTLGAVVAAALDAPAPVTVRPFGEAFDRKIAIAPELGRELLQGEAHYVVVDEGPGQSGSSFGAVAEWLQERGVPLERIAVLPSHSGTPGPAAAEERRRWWRSVQRQVGDFGERWPELVGRWSSDLAGPLDEPARDISGGAWRGLRHPCDRQWPAAVPAWERRKFLLRAGGEALIAKFAGLGRLGEDKLTVARTLGSESFVPEPLGIAHGFLVERWHEHASPLAEDEQPVRELARYIGTRARLLPAASGSGASAGKLLEMARRNVSLELGEEWARALDPWQGRASDLDRRIVRVRTDNKLDRQEWLRTASGALIKTDAIDHHQAHDLVGCQDVAWDCAGAIVEFELDAMQADQLVAAVAEWAGGAVDRELLDFCLVAYLAFRLGQWRLGETMICDNSEARRVRLRGNRYAIELQHLLESSCAPTRAESLVG